MKTISLLFFSLVLTLGCAQNIMPEKLQNPSPDEKFSHFNRFELLALKAKNPKKYDQALSEIQRNINVLLEAHINSWNNKSDKLPLRTLIIEPMLIELVHRFLPEHRSSIVLSVRFIEKDTDMALARPIFFADAPIEEEIEMLKRIANSFAVYTLDNYHQAIGGPVLPTEVEAATMRVE